MTSNSSRVTASALPEKQRYFQEMVERFQHSYDAVTKLNNIVHSVQKHPLLLIFLGVIALVILAPFLVISAILMAPLFFVLCSLIAFLAGILVVVLSFLSGFLLNLLLFSVTVTASCYILYRIIRDAICRVQNLLTHIASCPSRVHRCLKSRLHELCTQLLEGFSGDLGQRLRKGKKTRMDVKRHSDSDSSELEDIEPDYRDRESKLYDALVSRQYAGGDTFKPFRY